MLNRVVRTYGGTKNDNTPSKREIRNRKVALEAAAEGIVLLKNEDAVLPLAKDKPVALFGTGATHTVKGGIGSGDVNEREDVSVWQGLVNEGFTISSHDWMTRCDELYMAKRLEWRAVILEEAKKVGAAGFFDCYLQHPWKIPDGPAVTAEDIGEAETAIYVISRIAGASVDRRDVKGDYGLTDREAEDLKFLADHCKNVVVVLNTGGPIDTKEILAVPNVKAVVSLSQPGMEGGNALAKVLDGSVSPSGKLTATWAANYSDYPGASEFGHINGDLDHEYYKEGVYVGYRYFDTFDVEPVFPFGHGLTYTDFAINAAGLSFAENEIALTVNVKNTGSRYAGKEVVQVYVSAPQAGLPKEYRKLCAYGKTKLLAPGEEEAIALTIPVKTIASFDESRGAWITEAGLYGLWIGNSLENAELSGVLSIEKDVEIEKVPHICPVQDPLEEIVRPESVLVKEEEWHRLAEEKNIPVLMIQPEEIHTKAYDLTAPAEVTELVKKMTDDELIHVTIGAIGKGHSQILGSAGVTVPGSAGETVNYLDEKYGIPAITMADGPSGLRLIRQYYGDRETGDVVGTDFNDVMDAGFFSELEVPENADTYYQYCTAFPIGTMMAQTWNTELLEKIGQAVADEMEEFGVALWLAPGMNIQRNPLCGRNFEYYSEDPVISGTIAAAVTRGVQSRKGVGTTIKHFACNNTEDNRLGTDSILSERTLREIYLRGFEIAVKTSQPMAMMTSYNMVNGVHTPNSYDLCTEMVRNEWGFKGMIMTDWTTTMNGSDAAKCAVSGNDLIMPGSDMDVETISVALQDGRITREELEKSAIRVLSIVRYSLAFSDAGSYSERMTK